MSKQRSSARILAMFCFTWILGLGAAALAQASRQLVIKNESDKIYSGLNITTSGKENGVPIDCVVIIDSTNITIEDSQIGPCGGNGIHIYNSSAPVTSGIYIFDNYIHTETHDPNPNDCCDNNDGVFVDGTSQVTIQGNVIAYGESNIEANGATGTVAGVTVVGNFLLNPRGGNPSYRGQNFQAWDATNVVVLNNYTLSSRDKTKYLYADDQEDSINFGTGTGFLASHNYITGGHSPSGCGLIADEGANSILFLGNQLFNTGQCGIGIASGNNQLVDHNELFEAVPISGGGNTAVYVWNQYSEACGPVAVTHNIATEILKDGTYNSFWYGGGCDPLTRYGNTWDAAAQKLLTPPETKMPPPLIPPQPRNCVARSPYSTQTGWPACK
jgi:hypothetical protein